MRTDSPVDAAKQRRVVVKPFRAVIAKVASFGIIAIVGTSRLRAFCMIEPGFDGACRRWIDIILPASYHSFLSVINKSVGGRAFDIGLIATYGAVKE